MNYCVHILLYQLVNVLNYNTYALTHY